MSAFLTTKEVAALLQSNPKNVEAWCRKGLFPNAKRGIYSWSIPLSDVRAFTKPKRGTQVGRHVGLQPLPVEQRFWRKVDKSVGLGPFGNCWLWTGGQSKNGYGKITSDEGKTVSTHKLSYLLLRGPVPDGLKVLHTCDVRHCVQPLHLYIGTHAKNMEDRNSRNRQAKGPKTHTRRTKLTPETVKEIRLRKRNENLGNKELGRIYGVNESQISRAVNRKRWKHVE